MNVRTVFIAAGVLLLGCDVDFGRKPIADQGLARRIAEKNAAALSNPTDGQAWVALGDLYLEAERYFEAADSYKRGEDNGAKPVDVNGGLAITYLRLGFFNPSIDRMKKCFEIDRNTPSCLFALGQLLEQNGTADSLGEARRAYAHFLAIAPDHPKAAYVKSAIDQINVRIGPEEVPPPGSAASRPADHPPIEDEVAEPESPKGPAGVPGHGAGEGSEEVGELNPYGRAIAKALEASQKNDIVAAQSAYREALKIRPDDPSARAGLAETFFAQGNMDEAVKEIGATFDKHPEDPQVRWIFGLVMLRAGKRTQEAFTAWESLVKDYPDVAKQLGIPDRIEAAKRLMK